MPKNNGRGRPPKPAKGAFPPPAEPADSNGETPKFCLNFLREGYDVHNLSEGSQAAFARQLQRLAGYKWRELILMPKHGLGTELIPATAIKAPIPARFSDQEKFMVFRYDGNLPMVGVRVRDVFHVLWIERWFGELYDHGGS